MTRRLLDWESGLKAVARSGDGLIVDKARGKAPYLTHDGPDGWTKRLWFNVALAVVHFRPRPLTVQRLREAASQFGIDCQEEASR